VLPPQPPAWLVTNPPYGVRAGQPAEIRSVQQRLTQLARSAPACVFATLLPNDWCPLFPAQPAFRTRNGGLPVRLDVSDTLTT